MAINNVSVQYNGGYLPDIILLTQCYYHWGTHLNAMKMFCLCSLISYSIITFLLFNTGLYCCMVRRYLGFYSFCAQKKEQIGTKKTHEHN